MTPKHEDNLYDGIPETGTDVPETEEFSLFCGIIRIEAMSDVTDEFEIAVEVC